MNSQEAELTKNIIMQAIKGSGINESDYKLKTTNPHVYPTLTSLNDIITEDSTNG